MEQRDNIFTWWDAIEAGIDSGPLFVQRDSWSHRTVAEIEGTVPDWKQWRDRAPPYFGNPIMFGWVHWGNSGRYELVEIRCPGTFAYARIERPAWWRPPLSGSLVLSNGTRVDLGSRV